MHPLIESNREVIARLCRLHGVRSLEAFGSKLRDDFDAGRRCIRDFLSNRLRVDDIILVVRAGGALCAGQTFVGNAARRQLT